MGGISIEDIKWCLERSWCAASSSSSDWTPENPSLGQCAVTAMIVQDLLGGELLRCMVGDVSHYWNLLPDGIELDFTRQQFESFPDHPEVEKRSREYVESFQETRLRHYALTLRFDHHRFQLMNVVPLRNFTCTHTYDDGFQCHGTHFTVYGANHFACSACGTSYKGVL